MPGSCARPTTHSCAPASARPRTISRDAAALPAGLARRDRERQGERTLLERPHAAPPEGWHAGPLGALLLAARRTRARREAALAGGASRSAPTRARRCASSTAFPASASTSTAPPCPAEAGIVERAVSFTKGCYIGQEPIVRLAHRGHANRELHCLHLDDAARSARDPARRRARGRAPDERRGPSGGRRGSARLRSPDASRTALRSSRSTPGESASRLGTLVEWPQGARSSGDRAQPCGG